MSTGNGKGQGSSHRNVIPNIYAPKDKKDGYEYYRT